MNPKPGAFKESKGGVTLNRTLPRLWTRRIRVISTLILSLEVI